MAQPSEDETKPARKRLDRPGCGKWQRNGWEREGDEDFGSSDDEAANAQDDGDIEEDIEDADHQAEVDAAAEDVRARRSRAKELFGELVDILIQ